MACKITLIGAGSVVFAKTLIGDLLQFPELRDSTISLHDIDPKRLEVAKIVTNKLIQKLGVSARVEASLDRKEAIRGARYVICTIQVGGYKPGTVIDFEIPKKYGLRQTIADTLGIGGIFRGLRTIPVMVDIARDIEQFAAPGCLFLNYSNPMAMNCWAVDRAVGIPHVGLCHSVFGTARMLARHCQLDFDDVSYLVAGVNHMAFFLKFQYKGQDAYPLIWKVLNDPERNFEKVRYEMLRRTGYFVTESSEHQSEYVPYFIRHGDRMIEEFDIPLDEYIRRCEAINETWEKTERELIGGGGEIMVSPQSHEYGSYIIHSQETNTLRTVYGNIPNRGIIDNLPEGCSIEVPCQVDATGLSPVKVGALPRQLAAICRTQTNVQDLTVEAALTARRDYIYQAAMMDPHTSASLTLDKIWQLCDDLIEAHQAEGLLGEFSRTLPNSGRPYDGVGDRVLLDARVDGVAKMAANEENRILLSIENPGEEPVACTLEFGNDSNLFEFPDGESLALEVAAGEAKEASFPIRNSADLHGAVRVRIDCANEKVFTRDVVLRERKVAEPGEDAITRLEIPLHGFPAVELEFAAAENGLCLVAKVQDSRIEHDPRRFTDASHLDLHFSDQLGRKSQRIVILPGMNGEPPLIHRGKEKVRSVEQESDSVSYTITAILDWEQLGLEPGEPFLFDCAAGLRALGDAHSGGRTSLSGNFSAASHTNDYLLVKPGARVSANAVHT